MGTEKVKVMQVEKDPPVVTQEQVDEIQYPELSTDSFKVGDKEYSIRVLPWKWEMLFRKQALPLVKAEFMPIEQVIFNFRTERHLTDKTLHITENVIDAQMEADDFVLKAVALICVSQDKDVKAKAAAGEEITAAEIGVLQKKYEIMIGDAEFPGTSARVYLRAIITKQMDKQQMVQNLGEDLLTRLEASVSLVGVAPGSLSSLRQLFMQQVRNALEEAGRAASTWAKSFSPDMEHSSAISSQSRRKALAVIRDNAERELEKLDAEEQNAQKPPEPTPSGDENEEKKIPEGNPLVQ